MRNSHFPVAYAALFSHYTQSSVKRDIGLKFSRVFLLKSPEFSTFKQISSFQFFAHFIGNFPCSTICYFKILRQIRLLEVKNREALLCNKYMIINIYLSSWIQFFQEGWFIWSLKIILNFLLAERWYCIWLRKLHNAFSQDLWLNLPFKLERIRWSLYGLLWLDCFFSKYSKACITSQILGSAAAG